MVNDYQETLQGIVMQFFGDPNTAEVRDKITQAYYDLLNSNVDLQEFVVVCDDTNNTTERVAANQLWVDIAIKWNGREDFTYYPIRIMPAKEETNDESNPD